jgi:hypothetical protein
MAGDVDDGGVQREAVFREHWRDRQSDTGRPGDLIKQTGWMDGGLWTLGALLVVGVAAATTGTVARTATLPAVAEGTAVTAPRSGQAVPGLGETAQFRDTSGATQPAVIVEVTATELRAALPRPVDISVTPGVLDVPVGRQRLINVLLPGLW